ncbi:aspartyl-phosphate phosphatase Spo0E family protein [Natroniella sp. ANB-PHB2]|uniref:aspartyl-phosphate phosphatase Spo0E family protein n=1 Tax=Natroniella sp. ANB-PHB2 TaxID=3384444 RepID=UPI0038D3F8F7
MNNKLKEEIELLRRKMNKEAENNDLLNERVQAISRKLDKKVIKLMKKRDSS